jgi:hypothetical protein
MKVNGVPEKTGPILATTCPEFNVLENDPPVHDGVRVLYMQGAQDPNKRRHNMCMHGTVYIVKELSDTMHCIIKRAMIGRSRYETFKWSG